MHVKAIKVDPKEYMKLLGVYRSGIAIMAKKSRVLLFEIKDMPVGAANILKQDALSIGADLAVPTGVVTCSAKRVDALLIATPRQLERLIQKELAQPFGLKKVGLALRQYLKKQKFSPRIMGIINANDDSFYPGSRFLGQRAIEAIEKMIDNGAAIIDIGGMSTRPGSKEISEEEELSRIKPIVDTIYTQKLFEKVLFSIDTYRPKVARYALERGFKMLNDISALEDDELAKIAAAYGASVVLMHKKGTPQTMQQNPFYDDVVLEVREFLGKRIDKAERFGIKEIIIDPGIGFGKRLEDNLRLLRDLEDLKCFGKEILVGASRKSMIDAITPTPVKKRLPGTLAIHLKALENGASIIRCHDVSEHYQAIKVFKAIEEIV